MTASEVEDTTNEERFGFLSLTDDGYTPFADIPSKAVSLYCRHGQLTFSDNDDHPGVGRDGDRKRTEPEGIDDEDGRVRTDVPTEEDMISLALEPGLSDVESLPSWETL